MTRRTILALVPLLLLGVGGTGCESAASPAPPRDEAEDPDPSEERTEGGWTFVVAPANDLYPAEIADPTRSGFSIQRMFFSDSEIVDSGDRRFGLKLGGRFGLFRLHPRDRPALGIQVNIEAGFIGQFDLDHSHDNIGWDGIYGMILTVRTSDSLSFKLGFLHTSSHVGDEYIERTGRERIGYTREELQAAVTWWPADRWRAYLEGGWA